METNSENRYYASDGFTVIGIIWSFQNFPLSHHFCSLLLPGTMEYTHIYCQITEGSQTPNSSSLNKNHLLQMAITKKLK